MPTAKPKNPAKATVNAGAPLAGGRPASGRVRKNLMIDERLLTRVMRLTKSASQSDAIDRGLRMLDEHARFLAGLDAANGAIPDFPDLDT